MMHSRLVYSTKPDIASDLLILFGLMLALASTAALVLTLQTLVVGLAAKVVASVAGVSLQVCLYLFARHHNPRVKAFSVILLMLSVTMTTWYIEDTWQHLLRTKYPSEWCKPILTIRK